MPVLQLQIHSGHWGHTHSIGFALAMQKAFADATALLMGRIVTEGRTVACFALWSGLCDYLHVGSLSF